MTQKVQTWVKELERLSSIAERAFFYVRVFNPFAALNRLPRISSVYRKHENLKKRHYEQGIREIEHSTFTPLIFSLTGGLGPAATIFYKRLASPRHQMGSKLQCRNGLAPLQALILSTKIVDHVYQRGPLLLTLLRKAGHHSHRSSRSRVRTLTLNLVFTNQYTYN